MTDSFTAWYGLRNQKPEKRQMEFWPFLVCVASNKDLEKIYREFGPFYALPSGVKSIKVNDRIYSQNVATEDDNAIVDERDLKSIIDRSIEKLMVNIPDLPFYSEVDFLNLCFQFAPFSSKIGFEGEEINQDEIKNDKLLQAVSGTQ